MWRILFVILLATLTTTVRASNLTFLTHNVDGRVFIDEHGELRGIPHSGRRAFNVELVREMMMVMGHPRHFEVMPFKEALFLVQNEESYALFNISRNYQRERTVKWVGPLQDDTIYLYELATKPTGIKSIEDVQHTDGVCVIAGSRHQEIFQRANITNMSVAKDYSNCFKMLESGRVQLTPISKFSLHASLKEAGIPSDKIRQTPVYLYKTQGFIAFSKNISNSVVRKWQSVLDELKLSGKYDELVTDYLIAH